MSGDETHAVGMIAVGERDAGIRGAAVGRRDAGNHRKRYSRLRECLELFPAATKNERVAAFESHHAAPAAGMLDQQLVDRFLRRSAAAGRLADADSFGVPPRIIEYRRGDETVMQ